MVETMETKSGERVRGEEERKIVQVHVGVPLTEEGEVSLSIQQSIACGNALTCTVT